MSESQHREPLLSGVVVHWRNADQLARLVEAWPCDHRFELLVVDNSSNAGELPGWVRYIDPGRNLGFAGGANLGVAAARATAVLVLNPDARPEPGSLDGILNALNAFPDAAGVVPALFGPNGESQHRWQLRPLPSPGALLLQTLMLSGVSGPRTVPARGAAIDQPAGAALALRRSALAEVGGFDDAYYPAWFEDVDLARRLMSANLRLRYEPSARFVHELGGSLPALGYGPFLWIYHRNLARYLHVHHGSAWVALVRIALPLGMLVRLLLLPARRPRLARSRAQAASGLLGAIVGAVSGWHLPEAYRRQFRPPRTS